MPESWAERMKLLDATEDALTDVDLKGSLKLVCYGVGLCNNHHDKFWKLSIQNFWNMWWKVKEQSMLV